MLSAELLLLVLQLLDRPSVLWFLRLDYLASTKTPFRLKFGHEVFMIVDKTEARATSTTETSLKSEKHNLVWSYLVHLCDSFLEVSFRDARD